MNYVIETVSHLIYHLSYKSYVINNRISGYCIVGNRTSRKHSLNMKGRMLNRNQVVCVTKLIVVAATEMLFTGKGSVLKKFLWDLGITQILLCFNGGGTVQEETEWA